MAEHHQRWTPEEDERLLATVRPCPWTERHAGRDGFDDFAGRSTKAARGRYQILMSRRGHRGRWTDEGRWSPKEDATIRRAFVAGGKVPPGTWPDVALILGRTAEAVRQRAYKLRRSPT